MRWSQSDFSINAAFCRNSRLFIQREISSGGIFEVRTGFRADQDLLWLTSQLRSSSSDGCRFECFPLELFNVANCLPDPQAVAGRWNKEFDQADELLKQGISRTGFQ